MSESLTATLPLICWRGDRGTYHLVTFAGDHAEQIALHARLLKLELGTRRGFGSVKVFATIAGTRWKTSVFPQNGSSEWVLLVSRKVMKLEGLADGDDVGVKLELL